MEWPVDKIRKEYPILNQRINGERLDYLDNAATMQQPVCVSDAVIKYYKTINSNVHRGIYTLSNEATNAYENARKKVSNFINAKSPNNIIFTKSTTESLNLVAEGFGDLIIKPDDEIVISIAEHHSNLIPWQQLAQRHSAHLKYIELKDDGTLDLDCARKIINSKTKIVAVGHVSNVLGTLNPISEIEQLAHKNNAYFVVDGAQAISHIKVDVQKINADFYAFSGHKMGAPTGIGVLYGKYSLLNQMNPVQFGGEMIGNVSRYQATWSKPPLKFEAGTPNISGAIGLGATIDFYNALDISKISHYENILLSRMLLRLRSIPNLTIYGPFDIEQKVGVISFNINGLHPHDVATALDLLGIEVRAGHHCAEPLMKTLGIDSTIRASISFYNNLEDINQLVDGIKRVKEFFKK
ncbi:SufS family cysteine desulfurase [Companilactobacillus sp. HBUAS59544]|uniref:SufS family cysteine desulfurase n=1 Tax=Companilactobacillus sp. HBUAS59544 TaxID=3109363 RepID=UPI002FF21E7F